MNGPSTTDRTTQCLPDYCRKIRQTDICSHNQPSQCWTYFCSRCGTHFLCCMLCPQVHVCLDSRVCSYNKQNTLARNFIYSLKSSTNNTTYRERDVRGRFRSNQKIEEYRQCPTMDPLLPQRLSQELSTIQYEANCRKYTLHYRSCLACSTVYTCPRGTSLKNTITLTKKPPQL